MSIAIFGTKRAFRVLLCFAVAFSRSELSTSLHWTLFELECGRYKFDSIFLIYINYAILLGLINLTLLKNGRGVSVRVWIYTRYAS